MFKKNPCSYGKSYKVLRTFVNKQLAKAEREYVTNICDDVMAKPKRFWKFVKTKRTECNGIGTLKGPKSGEVYTEDMEKSELLNTVFESVFTVEQDTIRNRIPRHTCITLEYVSGNTGVPRVIQVFSGQIFLRITLATM